MTPLLNTALAKAKAEFPKILASKSVKIPTKSGREIKFTYAELEEIIPSVVPALSANGLAIAHQMLFVGDRYCLVSTLRHESGEQIESVFPLPMSFDDPKDLGNKIIYGRRYSTLCLLDIIAVDGDSNTEENKRAFVQEVRREAGLSSTSVPPKKGNSSFSDALSAPPSQLITSSSINREMVISEIDSVMRRKNISRSAASDMLKQWFAGAVTRQDLNDLQLVEFRDRLSLTVLVQ